jgi:uncharacterized protein with FMN-binding domain
MTRKLIEKLIHEIIVKQSLEVDDVSGATCISHGIKEVVKEAAEKTKQI